MIRDGIFLAVGVVLLAAAAFAGWRSWLGPSRDWERRRGSWVTARVVRIVEASKVIGPPYMELPARLELHYTLADREYSAKLVLERTGPQAYTRWQHLEVFIPASNRRRPRTSHEDNFWPEQLNGSAVLVILGLLTLVAGGIGLIRGS
jgi:hypothetical protein